tara:strand:- start:1 stop:210 length:210 start_codon:yes stop_codon:yes gene_type:complete
MSDFKKNPLYKNVNSSAFFTNKEIQRFSCNNSSNCEVSVVKKHEQNNSFFTFSFIENLLPFLGREYNSK